MAHSTLNRAVLADATGQPLGAMFSIPQVRVRFRVRVRVRVPNPNPNPNPNPSPQDNACVNVIDLEVATGRVSVVALNITPLAE